MKRSSVVSARMLVLAGAAAWMAGAGQAAFGQSLNGDRYAAIVMDARTNEILLADQADEARFPASLTKMMTLYMLFEALQRGELTLDSALVASRHAASQPPSRLGVRRGSVLTVDEAIRALCVQSANDVAVVVAERLGGSEDAFAAMMTERARRLGMTRTRFVNASGLPNDAQRTTARDMALLSQALWRDFPQYYHYFQTPTMTWGRATGRNHNRLLGQVEGVDGIKTGYTRASGYNLATMAERNGRRVITVVMGGETSAARDAQVAYLIEGAFEEFRRRSLPGGSVAVASLPVQRVDAQITPQGTVTAVSRIIPIPAPGAAVTTQRFSAEELPEGGEPETAPLAAAPAAGAAAATPPAAPRNTRQRRPGGTFAAQQMRQASNWREGAN